jgi:hypothetical protein
MVVKGALRRTTLLPLLAALLAVTVSGCVVEQEGDEEPTPEPTVIRPTVPPFATPPATPGSEPVTFRGRVMDFENGCEVDARCSIDVLVDEVVAGSGVQEGTVLTVIESYGLSLIRCYGQWGGGSGKGIGDVVEVMGQWFKPESFEYPEFSICLSADYYVKWISTPPCGPTSLPTRCPTPSPVPPTINRPWTPAPQGTWSPTPAPTP